MRLLGLLTAVLLLIAPLARAANVGFEEIKVSNGTDAPLTVGIWYPTRAAPSPQPLHLYAQDVALGAPPAGRPRR